MSMRIHLTLAIMLLAASTPARAGLDFSPDGRQLVFQWMTESQPGLALINTDGTGFATLPDSAFGRWPKWSPDGNHILFDAGPEGSFQLKVYNVTTQTTRALAENVSGPFAWREDSRWLAGYTTLDDGRSALVTYSLSEAGVTQRVPLPFDRFGITRTVWLPQTNDVALSVQTEKGQNLYTIESGEIKQITTSDDVISMALSGDGRRLRWARKSKNPKYILLSLYAYDLRRRSVVRLPFPERVPALNPDPRRAPESVDYVAFSPDGARLALLATFSDPPGKTGQPPRKHRVCYSIRMDGTGARLVRRVPYDPTLGDPLMPAWSRDSRRLAVLDTSGGQPTALALYNADGSGGKRLLSASSE